MYTSTIMDALNDIHQRQAAAGTKMAEVAANVPESVKDSLVTLMLAMGSHLYLLEEWDLEDNFQTTEWLHDIASQFFESAELSREELVMLSGNEASVYGDDPEYVWSN